MTEKMSSWLEAQPPQDSERALLHSQWLWKECGQCAVLQEELQQPAQVLQEQHPATSDSGFLFLSVMLVFILMSDCRRWSHSQSTCMARLCWWHATLPIPIRSQPICASTYHYCSLCLTFYVWRGFSSPESQPTRLAKMIWMLMSSTCMKGMFRWGRLQCWGRSFIDKYVACRTVKESRNATLQPIVWPLAGTNPRCTSDLFPYLTEWYSNISSSKTKQHIVFPASSKLWVFGCN